MQQTEREAAHGRDRDNGERGKSQTPILQLSCLTCKSKYIYIYTQLHVLYTVTLHKYDICKYKYVYIYMTYV